MSKNLEARLIIVFTICSVLSHGVVTQQVNSPMQCSEKGKDVNSQCSKNNDTDVQNSNKTKYTQHKGHLMPFGESGSKSRVKNVMGYPKNNFLLDYVFPSIPVLMKGAASLSPAFDKWTTDDYLLRLASLPKNRFMEVEVEKGKKDVRTGDGGDMTFYNFLKFYNKSDIYMVNEVTPFFEPLTMMPCPLQCQEFNQLPLKQKIWISSGGTKSVVHSDYAENIICMYRGKKRILLMDPATISLGTITDVMDGSAFSTLDVDSVDLNRFPTLRGASFVTADVEAGDCLYIPNYWIHYVNSIGSNIAVNVWFPPKETQEAILKGHCTGLDHVCDPTFTLGRVRHPKLIHGDGDTFQVGLHLIRSFFELSSLRGEASLTPENPPLQKSDEKVKTKEFIRGIFQKVIYPVPEDYQSEEIEKIEEKIAELLHGLDKDGDGVLTSFEFEHKIESVWKEVLSIMNGSLAVGS